MCDCFHLAFPNWHAPAPGAERRLRGPEDDSELQDSICEEPEILESERPRPQGSSPIEEFPAEKQTEENPYDLPHKSGSSKKAKKIGFGSRLDKRSPAKMNETEQDDSEVIVTAVKEAYSKGLVVTGGRKDGIFIKEVKPDSPASKLLNVKEGDQILSATIYFENVTHEDALQILECAQPYKMEFCLKRGVISTVPKHAETVLSEDKDGSSPKMRGQRKVKKQPDRISWPKFPSFGKGHKAQFRRSHSTSEAEEQRKLEISPQTSDAESPFKSPLKSPDGKDKKKRHKVKLKMKMKGQRSKTDEEPPKNEKEVLVVLENQDGEIELKENVSEEFVKKSDEVFSNIENGQTLQSLSGIGEHEVHLISLGNTLKTTNIPLAPSERECSEKKLKVKEKEISEVETENQSKTVLSEYITFKPSAFDNIIPKNEKSQFDADSSKQKQGKDSPEENLETKYGEFSVPTILDAEENKCLNIGSEKQNEKNIHENASYGIRTRGPLASMATSKTHFINTLNGFQFMSPNAGCDVMTEDSRVKYKMSDATLANLDTMSEPKFKMPNIDLSSFEINETIKMPEKEMINTHLPKREEIEIPGMEAKELRQNIPGIKVQKIEKIINISNEREEFNVKDVKEAVSKFPAFKLPERDITGVLVQRELKKMEMKTDQTSKGSPSKILITSTPSSTKFPERKIANLPSAAGAMEKSMKIPNIELPYIDDPTITATHVDFKTPTRTTKPERDEEQNIDANFKLLKREDIEIPGMEALNERSLLKDQENDSIVLISDPEKGKKHKSKKHGDIKGQEKKSKRPKTTMSSTEIPQPEFAVLREEDSSKNNDAETKKTGGTKKSTVKQIEISVKGLSDPIKSVDDNIEYNPTLQEESVQEAKTDKIVRKEKVFSPTKYKIPSITLPQFGAKASKTATDVSPINVQYRDTEISLKEEQKLAIIEPPSFCKESHVSKDISVQSKDNDDIQDTKFKLPKFEISFPEVKPPKITLGLSKTECDVKIPEEKNDILVVHSHEVQNGELQDDLNKMESKSFDLKMKRPGFSFPKIGFSKTETKVPEAEVSHQNVDVSLPKGSKDVEKIQTKIESVDDDEQKETKKFGSPSKFKLPSITFPKFGSKVSKVSEESYETDLGEIKRPEINVPEVEAELSAEPVLSHLEKKTKPVRGEIKDQEIQSECKDSAFKLPKFELSLPEVKGQSKKAEIDCSVPFEEQNDKDKDPEVTMKKTGFSFPRIGFGKSETKTSDVDENADATLQEAKIEMEGPSTDMKMSKEDSGQKDLMKFGSPTKFKLPSISLPKFGVKLPKAKVLVSDVDTDDLRPEKNVVDAEAKTSFEIKASDVDKEAKDLNVEIKDQDISIKDKESAFNFTLPKIDSSIKKENIEMSLPEGKIEVQQPEVHKPDLPVEVKADVSDADSKVLEVKMKRSGFTFPSIGFGKSEIAGPEVDVTLANVSLPETNVELKGPSTDIKESTEDCEQQESTNMSSTHFKLPSISLPQIGVKLPKPSVEASDVAVDVKGPEIHAPDAESKLSVEPLLDNINDKEVKDLSVEIKKHEIPNKGKESTFNLPNFGISLPEVKGPKIDLSLKKAETEINAPERMVEVQPPKVHKPDVTVEVKADLQEVDSKGLGVKAKRSGFTFPTIGFGKPEIKAPEVDVIPNADVSLPETNIEMQGPSTQTELSTEDSGQKDSSKFKLPSISFPKFGTKISKAKVEVSDEDIKIKRPEINIPNADIKPVEPLSVKIPDVDNDTNVDLNVEIKEQEVPIKVKSRTFNLPKFGISLHEVKDPKIDLSLKNTEDEIPLSAEILEVHPHGKKTDVTLEVNADVPEIDSSELEVKTKRSGFTFPSVGFSKSEVTGTEVDVALPNVDVTLPKESIDIEGPSTDIKVSKEDPVLKDSKFGSPTKFKLPSISLPKFGLKLPKAEVESSDVAAEMKMPGMNVPDAKVKLSVEPLSVEIKGKDVDQEEKDFTVQIKEQDILIKSKDSTSNSPKFGISLPTVKGPKIDLSLKSAETKMPASEEKVEVHPRDDNKPDVKVEVKADMPEIDSKGLEKTKRSGFTFPSIGFGKSEIKGLEVEVTNVDASLPEASIEMDEPSTHIDLSREDSGQKDSMKFGSPTKFKLPSISLPKFGTKASKAKLEVSEIEVDLKSSEINVPNADAKLSVEPLSVEIKAEDVDKKTKDLGLVEKKQDLPIKDKQSTFNLPRFGISLPEVKELKKDLSLKKAETKKSVPEGTVEVHPADVNKADVTVEVKANKPETNFKDLEGKFRKPGFTFPSIGFGKSEITSPEVDVALDVPLPETSIEVEGQSTDINVSKEAFEVKDSKKFGSPTKFKLPSISLPKFGLKLPKAEIEPSDVDLNIKRPEISVSDKEAKLTVEPLSIEIEMQDVDIEAKDLVVKTKEQQSISIKGNESTFSLPKCGIHLSEMKGQKIDLSLKQTETEMSLPEGKLEAHPPNVHEPDVTVEVEADIPDVDSKGLEVKTKRSGFTFPSIGFGKSENIGPDVDVTLPNADVSLPETIIELEGPSTEIELSKEDFVQKDSSWFGSPTKFKLPSISLPKFGTKASKAKVQVPDEEVSIKRSKIHAPDAEAKLSVEPSSVEIKAEDVDNEAKDLILEIKEQDISIKGKESTSNLPKLGIITVKGPKIDLRLKKTEMSLPEGKLEVQPDVIKPDVTVEVKADIPETDSKVLEVKTKRSGFTFPSIGFSKSEITSPEVDVALPKASLEIDEPSTDNKVSKEDPEQQDSTNIVFPNELKLSSFALPKPEMTLPEVEASDVAVKMKMPEINVPDAKVKLSVEPLSVEIKGKDVDKEAKDFSVQIKEQDISIKSEDSTSNLPKFGISLPTVKGPKIDLSLKSAETEMSNPEGKVEVHPCDVNKPDVKVEVKADMPEIDSKGLEKTKRSGFTFPSIGFGKSEIKGLEVEATNIDASLPEASIEMDEPSTHIHLSKEDSGQKDSMKFGSPTKFKLPSISLPKFVKLPKTKVEISDDMRPQINVADAEAKASVEIKTPDTDQEAKNVSTEIKEQDISIKGKDSTFNLPKFEISLPEVKGPKIDLKLKKLKTEISIPEGNAETHPPDINKPNETVDVTLPYVDVALPAASAEIGKTSADTKLSKENSGQKVSKKFGSPTKFKLPSISLPKFGTKASTAKAEVSDLEVEIKKAEIIVPDDKLQFSAKPLKVDIKGSDVEKEAKSVSVEINDQDFPVETKDSKFKLPKFAISLPDIKGPKIDFSKKKADVSVSKGTETHQHNVNVQDAKAEVKADPPEVFLPEGDVELKEQNTDIKLSKDESGQKDSKKFGSPTKFIFPSISLPKFGPKVPKLPEEVSEVGVDAKQTEKCSSDAAPEAIAILPNVDVSLSDETESSKKESGQKDSKFASPTKFKLPSISLPKFGTKVSNMTAEEIGNVSVESKRPDKRVPDIEIKVTPETIKEHDIIITSQEICPEVKKLKIGLGSDKIEAKAHEEFSKVEKHPSDVKVQNTTTAVTSDIPDSNVPEVKVKKMGFSLPKFGFSKHESPETILNLQASLPQESLEMEVASTDDVGETALENFDSPTKFKLPSIKIPKFGLKVTKETVDKSSVEVDVKPPEICLSDSEKLPEKPLQQSVDINLSNVNVKGTVQSPDKKDDVEINCKVDTPETAKISISRDKDTFPDVKLEPKFSEYSQELKKSPKPLMPIFGDFVKAFDVEFYIPTLDEIEEAKRYTSDSLQLENDSGISQPSVCDSKVIDLDVNTEKKERQSMDQEVTVDKNKIFQPSSKVEENPFNHLNDKDVEKSSTREIEIDSPTLSLRSSDAFADVSSAPITEQITSPTKVKVAYSESSATAEVSDIHSEVFTSTTRTELITIVPHQPEKVNIPFSPETSSSLDTLKEMSGKIHIVKNYVQTETDTQHAAIFSNIDTEGIQTVSGKSVAESMLSIEKTTVQKEHTFVEKHVVKEIFSDDKASSLVTQKIHVFEGEPIPDDTTFSIQKLKDTVHSEKMRFFESGEASKTIIMSSETKMTRHTDFSKKENEEK